MKIITHISIASIVCCLLSVTVADAARVFPSIVESKNGVITVAVLLDPQGESVNIVTGSLQYDPQTVAVRSIRTMDSVVGLWIDSPSVSTPGTINYSGGIQGGFDGVRSAEQERTGPGILFTILLTPLVSGNSTIELTDLEVRANDGKATALPVDTVALQLFTDGRYADAAVAPEIPVAPSDARLTATVFRDSIATENKWAVAFAADTNRVTIARYEIAESLQSNPLAVAQSAWHSAQSPFILNDQFRTRYVHVRAIAENGQVYMTSVSPEQFSTTTSLLTWGILVIVFFVLAIGIFRFFKRRNQ